MKVSCSPLRFLLACGLLLLAHQAALANTIDSDVSLTSVILGTVNGVVAEGRLTLASNTIKPSKYTGTFVDNFDGGKSFVASADTSNAAAPVLTLTTRFGKFVFNMDSSFGTGLYFSQTVQQAPPSLQSSDCQLGCVTHQFTTKALYAKFQFGAPFEGASSTVDGTLVLIVDALDFVAPKDSSTHSTSYLALPGLKGKILRTAITAPSYFGRFGAGALGETNRITINTKLNGRFVALEATETGNDTGEYVGPVFKPGAGSAAVNGVVTIDAGAPIP